MVVASIARSSCSAGRRATAGRHTTTSPPRQALACSPVAKCLSGRGAYVTCTAVQQDERPGETVSETIDSNQPSTSGSFLDAVLEEARSPQGIKTTAVEFMAQALFNFASCSAVCYSKELVGDAAGLMPLPVMAAHFIILFTLIGGTQPISGGHFNPMVSAVMAYWGAIPRARLPLYIGAQVSGATIGSALQWSLLAPELRDAVHAGVQAVPPGHTLAQAFAGEVCAAFILMFIVCTVALDKKGDPSRIPLVMALVIPILIFLVGPVSSMCINPARALGPALASGFWEHHWLWWTAPFVGGFAAVVPYKFLSELEEKEA